MTNKDNPGKQYKIKRDRLFKKDRPFIRPLNIYDGDKYHKDMGILWAAYLRDEYYDFPKDMSQEEFANYVEEISKTTELLMIEDFNSGYKNRGPVAFVMVYYPDYWRMQPHAVFFSWATPKNILRASVAFLQKVRYSRTVGVCIIHALQKSKNLFDRCIQYGVLSFVGKMRRGDPRGDDFIYSVRGRKNELGPEEK